MDIHVTYLKREQERQTAYPCSSRWGPPVRRHQSPGSPRPALAAESLPDPAESRLHDHEALVCGEEKQRKEG